MSGHSNAERGVNMLNQETKQRLLEKLASQPKMPSGTPPASPKGLGESAKNWGKKVGKEALDPKALGGALRKALAKGAVLGGGVLAAKYLKKKPSLMQQLIGKDTPGRKALMFGAGAAGIAGGLKGVESIGDAISTPIKKKKYFNNMMDENPGLKKEPKRDVERIFRTLFKFNPTMASDPLVAGSFLKRSLQFKDEGIQPVDVKTLTEISKSIQGSKKNDGLLRSAFAGSGAELLAYA